MTGSMGGAPMSMQDMQALHLKMSKKIAQLTKVIYILNTKNDDHEYDAQCRQEQHTHQLRIVARDSADKVATLHTALVEFQNEQQRLDRLERQRERDELQRRYEQEKERALAHLQNLQSTMGKKEEEIRGIYEGRYEKMRREVDDAKTAFLSKMHTFSKSLNQLKRQHEEEAAEAIRVKEQEVQDVVRRTNEHWNELMKQRILEEEERRRLDDQRRAQEQKKARDTDDRDAEKRLLEERRKYEEKLRDMERDQKSIEKRLFDEVEKRKAAEAHVEQLSRTHESNATAHADTLQQLQRDAEERIASALREQSKARDADRTAFQRERDNLAQLVRQHEATIAELRERVRLLEEEIRSAHAQRSQSEQQLYNALRSNQQSDESERLRLAQQWSAEKQQLLRDESRKREELTSEWNDKERKWNLQRNELAAALEALRKDKQSAELASSSASSALSKRAAELEQSLTQLRDELARAQQQAVADLRAREEAHEQHSRELQARFERELAERQSSGSERERELMAELANIKDQLSAAETAATRSRNELNAAHAAELARLRADFDAQLRAAREERDKLQRDLDGKIRDELDTRLQEQEALWRARLSEQKQQADADAAAWRRERDELLESIRMQQSAREADKREMDERLRVEKSILMSNKDSEIASLKAKLNVASSTHTSALSAMAASHANALTALRNEHEQALQRVRRELDERDRTRSDLETEHAHQLQALQEERARALEQLEAKLRQQAQEEREQEARRVRVWVDEVKQGYDRKIDSLGETHANELNKRRLAEEEREKLVNEERNRERKRREEERAAEERDKEMRKRAADDDRERAKAEQARLQGVIQAEIEARNVQERARRDAETELARRQTEFEAAIRQLERQQQSEMRDTHDKHCAEMAAVIHQHVTELKRLADDKQRREQAWHEREQAADERYREKEAELAHMTMRFERREARPEDVLRIRQLEEYAVEEKKRRKKAEEERKIYLLELQNREENYNKMFNRSPVTTASLPNGSLSGGTGSNAAQQLLQQQQQQQPLALMAPVCGPTPAALAASTTRPAKSRSLNLSTTSTSVIASSPITSPTHHPTHHALTAASSTLRPEEEKVNPRPPVSGLQTTTPRREQRRRASQPMNG